MAQYDFGEDEDGGAAAEESDGDDDPWGAAGPTAAELPGDVGDHGFGGHGGGGGELERLCEEMQGLPVADVEETVREFLKRSRGEASDADTLAVLLIIFRAARDSALEGYEPWDNILGFCTRMTDMCDANFACNVDEDGQRLGCFPASVVGMVYAESGRTFALADLPGPARDRLVKALNAFELVPGGGDEAMKRQLASARASLARVLRRGKQYAEAVKHYMEALQLYIELDMPQDLCGVIGEWSETVVEAGPDEFAPSVPPLLCQLAEQFGEGSDLHTQVLQDVVDACVGTGNRWAAAEALTSQARLLREGGSSGSRAGKRSGARQAPAALLAAQAEAAEEEAAAAWEEAVARHLEAADLEAAAAAWAEALRLREALAGGESELVLAMRASLDALRQAAAAQASGELDDRPAPSGIAEEPAAAREAPDSWEDEAEDAGSPAAGPRDAW